MRASASTVYVAYVCLYVLRRDRVPARDTGASLGGSVEPSGSYGSVFVSAWFESDQLIIFFFGSPSCLASVPSFASLFSGAKPGRTHLDAEAVGPSWTLGVVGTRAVTGIAVRLTSPNWSLNDVR